MEYSPKELALKIARILDAKKADGLSVISVAEVTEIADYFVITTGHSSTQVKAFADEIEMKLKQEGIEPDHIEGHKSRTWIVMDYQCVVVHIFDEQAREYYDLERLWKDGTKIDEAEYVTANSAAEL